MHRRRSAAWLGAFFLFCVPLASIFLGAGEVLGAEPLRITPLWVELDVGGFVPFSAIVGGADVAASPATTWRNSNPSVAQITAQGTAICLRDGCAEITATHFRDGLAASGEESAILLCSGSGSWFPGDPVFSVIPETAFLVQGENVSFIALLDGMDVSADPDLFWSADSRVAALDAYGGAECIAPGVTAIDAALFTDDDGIEIDSAVLTCGIDLASLPAPSFSISPDSFSLAVGASTGLTAELNGFDVTRDPFSSWSSNAPQILVVQNDGTALCLSPGSATVTARYAYGSPMRATSASSTVMCAGAVSPTTFELSLTLDETSSEVGYPLASVAYLNQLDVTDSPFLTLSSADEFIARIHSDGRSVVCQSEGSVMITATYSIGSPARKFIDSTTLTCTDSFWGGGFFLADLNDSFGGTALSKGKRSSGMKNVTLEPLGLTRMACTGTPPEQPVPRSPEDGATDVTLEPNLSLWGFVDPDGSDTQGDTEWQLSASMDFASLLLDTASFQSTTLPLPPLLLEPASTYYWRARFFDSDGNMSRWSTVSSFSTVYDGGDTDGNGIPDVLEIGAGVDLDGNGASDVQQSDIRSLNTRDGGGMMAIAWTGATDVLGVDAVESIQLADVSAYAVPFNMPLGLFAARIIVANPGDAVEVTFHFSEPAPADARWFVYDPINRWADLTDEAAFNADRTSVTVHLQDGGRGDADGIPNGTITDPGGFGLASWVKGRVTDAETGAPVRGATVSIADVPLNTGPDGGFLSVFLPGSYDIVATSKGYEPQRVSGKTIPEGGTLVQDFILTPAPNPTITANGAKDAVRLSRGTPLSVTLALDVADKGGTDADWWVAQLTPEGELRHLDLTSFTLAPDLAVTYQGTLFRFDPLKLLELSGLATGAHTFFFGVDLVRNGQVDAPLYYDSVSVTVSP